jgi:hypothetical protein
LIGRDGRVSGRAEVTAEIHRDRHGRNRREGTGFLHPGGGTFPDFPLVAFDDHLDDPVALLDRRVEVVCYRW